MKIKTECKDCIFALYNTADVQLDCAADQLQKYQALDTVSSSHQDGKTYYVIDNRFCMYCRNKEWLDKRPEGEQHEDTLAFIRKQITLQYQIFLIADSSLENIEKTIKSVAEQIVKPKLTTVIRLPTDTNTPAQIISLLRKYELNWKVENVIGKETDYRLAIDSIVANSKIPFYAVFKSGFVIPSDTFDTIDKKINDDLQQIVLLKPVNGNGLFVSQTLHKQMFGSHEKYIEDKVEAPYILEVCKNFPTDYAIKD